MRIDERSDMLLALPSFTPEAEELVQDSPSQPESSRSMAFLRGLPKKQERKRGTRRKASAGNQTVSGRLMITSSSGWNQAAPSSADRYFDHDAPHYT